MDWFSKHKVFKRGALLWVAWLITIVVWGFLDQYADTGLHQSTVILGVFGFLALCFRALNWTDE